MKPEIIAEVSCNHAGSLDRALALVTAAAGAGADAVKLQTWKAGTMVLDPAYVLREGPWVGRNLFDLYAQAYTPWEWIEPIFRHARTLGIEAFSSVFDAASLEFLEDLGCPRYKVSSFELVDIPLIKRIVRTGKPIILSTGMAERAEITDAVLAIKEEGWRGASLEHITLLKCTSAYPADPAAANLQTMAHMRSFFQCQVGLSDHTPGVAVALIAASMGASMIEKHLFLDDGQDTLDAAFSITPSDLAFLCREAPKATAAVGEISYGPLPSEKAQLRLRRSLYFARDKEAGQMIGRNDLCTARPALGLSPRMMGRLIGRTTFRSVKRGQPVSLEDVCGRIHAVSQLNDA